ncbi:MFS transporter [Olsenella sp. Marseille-QA0557]|uniref:MFS transporter n=1 Tax=Olsenella sp. Marseille-QA0557 TaxID=3378782 RepID=UPI003D0A2461
MGENLTTFRRYLCVFLLVVLGLSLGVSEFVVIGIEPELAASFGVPLSRVGELISVYSATYAIITPILALTTGRLRRFQLLVAYSVVFCIGNSAAVIAANFTSLLLARVLLGSVSGALLAVGVTYIPELVSKERVSQTIAIVYAAFSVAMVLATSAGRLIADRLNWDIALIGTLVLALVTCIALVAFLPRHGATDEPATFHEQVGLLKEPCVLGGMSIFIFGVGSVYVFYGYVTPYLEQILGVSPTISSAVLMGYGIACLISNLTSGWIASRFGLKALIFTFPVQALLLFSLWMLGGSTLPALVIVLLIGLSMYLVSVPCVTMFMGTAAQRHPKALTLASSLEPMAFNVGIAFGTAVGGSVVAGPGLASVGLVGALFSVVACALAALTTFLEKRSRVLAQQDAL